MMTGPTATQTAIQHYLDQIAAGLKGIDVSGRRDILAEIDSHLSERIAELESAGDGCATEHALESLGDPTQLAAQFVAEARTRSGARSYAPWILLRRAARVARTSIRGVLLFLIGLFGYVAALGGLIVIVMKLFIPGVGLWVGSWGMVWGIPPSGTTGRELLGKYFVPTTAAVSFALACGTTVLLRWMTKKIPFFSGWPSA